LDAPHFIGDSDACSVKIELAAKVFRGAGVRVIQPEVTERLIGFGEHPLHLPAELVGEVIVLLFEYSGAYGGEMVLCVAVVAIARLTGPKGVFVELEEFFVERSVFTASEDHRAEAAIADR
jgi:hypothetical protein